MPVTTRAAVDSPALASERGAGGIVSTGDDQRRFNRAFHRGELFADPTRPFRLLPSVAAANR